MPSDTIKTNVIKPPVSRPPISILPDDPEEKRKSVINNVLEQFPYLSSIIAIKISIIFILIVQYSALYAIKIIKKKIRYNVEGEWGSGDYVNTKTYCIKCWEAYQNSIQIVTVKA